MNIEATLRKLLSGGAKDGWARWKLGLLEGALNWTPGAPLVSASAIRGAHDEFTAASTPATSYTLSYIPINGTCEFALNGLVQEESSDYTCDYTSGVVSVSASLSSGDHLTFRYLATSTTLAAVGPPGTFDTELGGTDAGASGQIARSYTAVHDCLLLYWVTWATSTNTTAPSTISDSNSLTWTKLAEAIQNNAGNPDTVAVACYALTVGSTPITGTVTATVPAHAAFDVYPMSFDNATAVGDVASGHAATAKGINVGSVSLSLAAAPAGNQSTLTGMVNWPHKTITEDAAYTEIVQADNPGGGGPYGQQFRHAYAYDLAGSSGATLTNAATADSAAVMITVKPT